MRMILILALIIGAALLGACSSSNNEARKAPDAAGTLIAAATKITKNTSPTPKPPTYTLQIIGQIACATDSTNTRECKGIVRNLQADKNVTDVSPVMHWAGGTDSDFGTVDINPILPGQDAHFSVFTLHANPALTNYTIGFKKIFGKESDYPVAPMAP